MTAYEPLTPLTLPHRLGGLDAVASRVGGDPASWSVEEVGDGNLNLVFIVRGAAGSVIVKQALPYVRLVGDSWPLPLNRSFFEFHALSRHARHDPGRVPDIFHFDEGQALIVMRHLTPHVIFRKSVVNGKVHPKLGRDMGLFLARTLFGGSALALDGTAMRKDLALFAENTALSDITENLVFSDPYFPAKLNRHTPGLEPFIAPLRADRALRIAAQEMKHAFVSKTETLVHGDLHSGSIMVTAEDTQVIDPEFAMYGPFGFDVGMLLANILLAFFAQAGHETRDGERDAYRAWLLETFHDIWTVFAAEFRLLWRTARTGILYEASVLENAADTDGSDAACARVLAGIWRDATGFIGVEMHRRILGLAHVEDLEAISDPARRIPCEARALALGRIAAVERMSLSPSDITDLARSILQRPPA
ncbi:MAG: S-methyl-5-thioribose kinase [Rhizobiaceae bacterium]|nr:S-methyl-5-thioribose kinase [Rhizobiaceae bacterium]